MGLAAGWHPRFPGPGGLSLEPAHSALSPGVGGNTLWVGRVDS